MFALAALVLMPLSLGGCSSISSESSTTGASAPELGFQDSSDKAESDGNSQRDVVRSALISIETEDLEGSALEAQRVVAGAEGYVEWQRLSSNDLGIPYSNFLQVRIPNPELDRVLNAIKLLGAVVQLEISSSDVTSTVIDLGARVRSLSASVARLEALALESDSVSELIEIESALSERQAELESLQSQLSYIESQVAYSTISLSLFQEGRGPVSEPEDFFGAVLSGFEALTGFLYGLLVAFGFALPWLLAALPVMFAIWFALKRYRNRLRRP